MLITSLDGGGFDNNVVVSGDDDVDEDDDMPREDGDCVVALFCQTSVLWTIAWFNFLWLSTRIIDPTK